MNNYDEKIQTEYLLPAALSPPDTAKRRSFPLKKICSLLCALLAIATLCLCAVQKLNETLERGIIETLGDLLLREKGSISESVFGSPIIDPQSAVSLPNSYLTLPRIYYIPRESIIENSANEAKELEKSMFELYAFDYSKVPKGSYPIVPTDLSTSSPLSLKNDTTYEIDMNKISLAAAKREKEAITKEPLVLIVHTHGTESFSKNTIYYNDEYNVPRSTDVSENAVAVGKALAEALNKKGIPTIQCETMHDKESYISAYDRSAESIQYYLEKYPSIKYVFDVHRDSLIQSDLTKLRPVTLRDGKACAQIMIIVGSGEKSGIDYPFEDNLVLAEAIQENLFDDTIGTARQLYLRGATYNQQYSRYGLLLEIGSCGNTLEEAKNAALAFADAFEKVIK